jgi:hypothetical protein
MLRTETYKYFRFGLRISIRIYFRRVDVQARLGLNPSRGGGCAFRGSLLAEARSRNRSGVSCR